MEVLSDFSLTSVSGRDHWTPWTDFARSGQKATPAVRMAGMSTPSEALKPVGSGMNMSLKNSKLVAKISDQGTPILLVFPQMATGLNAVTSSFTRLGPPIEAQSR